MRAGSLDACFAKRQRAGSQLQQLTREVGWFLERRPYRVFLDADPKAHAGIWRVQFYEKPDPAWSLLISELLVNLRCSLDYLVCELTIQAGNTVTKFHGVSDLQRTPVHVRKEAPDGWHLAYAPTDHREHAAGQC
jgi:hypothetical protein